MRGGGRSDEVDAPKRIMWNARVLRQHNANPKGLFGTATGGRSQGGNLPTAIARYERARIL